MKQLLFLLLLMGLSVSLKSQKIIKVELVFKTVQVKEGKCTLEFTDHKNKAYSFNAQRSNTAPYIFYSTSGDGSVRENEKIKGVWFLISYTFFQAGKARENMLLAIEEIKKKNKI